MVLCWYCTGHSVSTIAQPWACHPRTTSMTLLDMKNIGIRLQTQTLTHTKAKSTGTHGRWYVPVFPSRDGRLMVVDQTFLNTEPISGINGRRNVTSGHCLAISLLFLHILAVVLVIPNTNSQQKKWSYTNWS